MLLKGLMGIEYVAIIGIFLLILTAASLQSVENGPGEVVNGGPDIVNGGGSNCGDGSCSGAETCVSCSSDCGSCIPPTIDGGYISIPTGRIFTSEGEETPVITIQDEKTIFFVDKVDGIATIEQLDPTLPSVAAGETVIITLKVQDPQNLPSTRVQFKATTDNYGLKSITATSLPVPEYALLATSFKENGRFALGAFNIESDFAAAETTLRFAVREDAFQKFNIHPEDVVASLTNPETFEIEFHIPTTEVARNIGAQGNLISIVYITSLPSQSLFVINAQQAIKPFSTCNNDGECSGIESPATCPLDCVQLAFQQTCEGEETRCFGQDVLYRCVSGELLKAGVCEFGCSGGACLTEPPSPFQNTLYILLIAVTIVMGLILAALFLRK